MPCDSSDKAPIAVTGVAGAVGVGMVYKYASMDPLKQRLTTATAALTLGQTAAAVQALGAFRQFQIVWREPVLSLLDAISLLALDIKVIRVECALETDNPVNIVASGAIKVAPVFTGLPRGPAGGRQRQAALRQAATLPNLSKGLIKFWARSLTSNCFA